MAVFEIYKDDLTEQAQQELCRILGVNNLKEMNYDILPITQIEFDDIKG